MAKRLHPTAKSIRQGQTVYHVWDEGIMTGTSKLIMEAHILYSHKMPLPPLGCLIEKMPVNILRRALNITPHRIRIFYSKSRAEQFVSKFSTI